MRPERAATHSPGQSPWVTVVARLSPCKGKSLAPPSPMRPERASTTSPGQSPWVTVVARMSPCKGKSFPHPKKEALLSITDGRASRFLIHFFKIIAHRRAMALQRYEENPKWQHFPALFFSKKTFQEESCPPHWYNFFYLCTWKIRCDTTGDSS